MDYMWVPDMNSRKYGSYLPNPSGQETSSMGRRGIEDTSLNATPFENNPSHVSGLSGVRRPRADTMPSRTTVFPYTASTTTDNSGSSSTAVATPNGSDLYLGGGSSANLAIPANDVGRRRSGSVTLLSSSDSNTPRQVYGNTLFTSGFPPYHMMEENATDTVQSTLASLGLDDTLVSADSGPYLSSTGSISPQTSTQQHQQTQQPQQQQQQQQSQQQQQQQRHRAYTVTTRHPSAKGDRLGEMLPMGFSPFSPQTRSSVMQRPRAVSLGVVDDPHFDDEVSSFSPFGMTSLQSTVHTSSAQQNHHTHHQQQQQQQQHPPSRLGQQVLSNTQQSLRMSRSSGNLMDISGESYSVTNQFDTTGIYDSTSMEDLAHQDDANAMPSVSSSTSALLDSPSSAPAQIPSRALWLGNINPSLSVNDLLQQFALYGKVESARILSDKECAFVNFSSVESAVAAKNDLESRLGSKLGGSLVRIGFGKADVTLAMALTNEAGPNAQGPTRALWVGNIPANMNIAILQAIFQAFGPIESIRVLSHKNCGFVNFEHQEDAVRARKNLQNKEILGPGSGTVRIGFAKAPSADDINNADPGFVSISPQSQPMAPTQYQMYQQQQQQHPLPQHHLHQNQNYPPQPQNLYQQHQRPQLYMPHAYSQGQQGTSYTSNSASQHDISGNMPSTTPSTTSTTSNGNNNTSNNNQSLSTDTYQATQWATAMMMTTMMMNASGKKPTTQPSLYSAIAAEREFIMQQLRRSTDTTHQQQQAHHERPPISYFSVIPAVPELSSERTLEPLRLRDMRKRLESGQALQDVEMIAHECMNEIVELCSDYIGNTVVQKLFEHCTESTKQVMLERIAPFLAAIGVHKNGTWAAQKIIDYANTPGQIETIQQHIAPYVPLLLLDQFGNYVVQCCLRMGAEYNQYIFDAIVDKCWEIGQGRFGARAVRAILETDVVSKEQQIYCAAAIVQNAVLLTTNANGTLLLVWLLDTSELSGRYRVLYPRLLPYLSKICTHKLGSMTVYKIIQQQEEPDTSRLFLNALTTDPHLLDDILRDQIHGVSLVQKIMALPHINSDKQQRITLVQLIRASLDRLNVHQIQGYKRLTEELDLIPSDVDNETKTTQDDDASKTQQKDSPSTATSSLPSSSSAPSISTSASLQHQQQFLSPSNPADEEAPVDMVSWMKNPQAVAMMANMYAAAMTAAATTQQQQQQQQQQHQGIPMTKVPELPQFNHILKSLLTSSESPMSSSSSSPSLATSDSSSSTNNTSSSPITHSDGPTTD